MINAQQKVGEIVSRQPSTSDVFEQLGIQYCCHGEETLEATCRDLGLPIEGVLSELNRAAVVDSSAKAQWEASVLDALIGHLLRTRKVLLNRDLPRIQVLAGTLGSCHLPEHPNTIHIAQLSGTLVHEVASHFTEEAQIVFPKIREIELAYVGASSSTGNLDSVRRELEHMTHEHGAVGDLLSRIQDLTFDYDSTTTTCDPYREMCQQLKKLDGEVRQEVHLENNVLFNRALQISGALHG